MLKVLLKILNKPLLVFILILGIGKHQDNSMVYTKIEYIF